MAPTDAIRFPSDFVWGSATASYQIEGAVTADGRGDSIWDAFCRTPGKVLNGDSGERASDHYNRYRDDVALMKSMGLNAYRFSIAWPRVLPDGTGKINQAGLDFYSALVDELLGAGIEPWPTLYHWDLPQALQERGGWPSRDVVDWFGEYTAVIAGALGDRVKHWMTLNEPQVFCMHGYLSGHHAPGVRDVNKYLAATHHCNMAHGRAVQVLRAQVPDAQVGTVMQTPPMVPAEAGDEEAARLLDGFFNRFYLDPVLKGRYPDDAVAALGDLGLPVHDGDLGLCNQPLDFVGINNYSRTFVTRRPNSRLGVGIPRDHRVPGAKYTAMDWEVYPNGIYEVITRYWKDYGVKSLYITENGGAFDDKLVDGQVDDGDRVELLHDYLAACHRAMGEGAPLKGYFVWSFLDNFEWSFGYDKRFGIVHVDYDTMQRTPKRSAAWLSKLVETGQLPPVTSSP